MSTTISKAVPADIPVLVELMHEFHAASGFTLDRAGAATAYSALLSDASRGVAWIAIRDNAPVGYVVLTFRFSMEAGGTDAFIDDMYVQPIFRRLGHGGSLLKELFSECERRRVHSIRVEVASDNVAAHALYWQYGLKDIGRQTLTVALAKNSLATKF